MKGRNTTVVSVRISDEVYRRLKIEAGDKSVGEFIKEYLMELVTPKRFTRIIEIPE